MEMETHLRSAIGCQTNVSFRSGKGRIVFEIGSRDEFDRIYELLMNTVPVPSEDELIAQKRSANNGGQGPSKPAQPQPGKQKPIQK